MHTNFMDSDKIKHLYLGDWVYECSVSLLLLHETGVAGGGQEGVHVDQAVRERMVGEQEGNNRGGAEDRSSRW